MPQVLPDEADPESPAMVSDRPSAIAEEPSEAKPVKEVPLQFQAGDRLQVTNLAKQNEQWTGEVAEVLEVSEAEIKVIVRVPCQLM
jgi:predicted XRE-type DNA-binding protein